MNWSPNMNQGQQPAPSAGQPQTQQAQAPTQQPAPGGYQGPGAGQNYGGSSVPSFSFGRPSLNDSDPELPYGDHILEVAAPRDFVGQSKNMLIVPFVVVQTNNPQVPVGTKGTWKRSLQTGHRANSDIVTGDIARMVVPLSGRPKDKTSEQDALNLVGEFWHQGTIDGKQIVGMRVGATCRPGDKPDRNGKIHTQSVFHTL
jgi:hypothetical protein